MAPFFCPHSQPNRESIAQLDGEMGATAKSPLIQKDKMKISNYYYQFLSSSISKS